MVSVSGVFELMDRNDDGYIDASDLSQERCEWIESEEQAPSSVLAPSSKARSP